MPSKDVLIADANRLLMTTLTKELASHREVLQAMVEGVYRWQDKASDLELGLIDEYLGAEMIDAARVLGEQDYE